MGWLSSSVSLVPIFQLFGSSASSMFAKTPDGDIAGGQLAVGDIGRLSDGRQNDEQRERHCHQCRYERNLRESHFYPPCGAVVLGLALSPRAGWSVILLYLRVRRTSRQPMRGMAGMLLSNDSRRPCNRMQRAVLAKPLFSFASTRNALSTSVTPACQCSRGGIRTGMHRMHRMEGRPRHSSPNPSFQRRLESRVAVRPYGGRTGHRSLVVSLSNHATPPTRHSSPNPSFQRRLESRVAVRPYGGRTGHRSLVVQPVEPRHASNPSFQRRPGIQEWPTSHTAEGRGIGRSW